MQGINTGCFLLDKIVSADPSYLSKDGLPNFLFKFKSIEPLNFLGNTGRSVDMDSGGVVKIPFLHTDLKDEIHYYLYAKFKFPSIWITIQESKPLLILLLSSKYCILKHSFQKSC